MVRAMKDKYSLGESQDKTIESRGGSIRLDISLNEISSTIGGTVEGCVRSATNNQPIEGAIVKITNSVYEPISYAVTDKNGRYLFSNINQTGIYNIFSIAKGKKISIAVNFSLIQGDCEVIDINLEDDASSSLGIIVGEVDDIAENPIGGGIVSLYKKENGVSTLFGVTYVNEYGQYAFRDVINGEYSIKVASLGYIAATVDNIIFAGQGSIKSYNIILQVDSNASNGVISGVVSSENNTPINRADVILYKIETNNTLTPISYTKTNSNGVYMFSRIPPGDYRIMANEIEVVEFII